MPRATGATSLKPARLNAVLVPPGGTPVYQTVTLAPPGGTPVYQTATLAPPGGTPADQTATLAPPGGTPADQDAAPMKLDASPMPFFSTALFDGNTRIMSQT